MGKHATETVGYSSTRAYGRNMFPHSRDLEISAVLISPLTAAATHMLSFHNAYVSYLDGEVQEVRTFGNHGKHCDHANHPTFTH